MRLFDMDESFPESFGCARVLFNRVVSKPELLMGKITLPGNRHHEIFTLRGGLQFLFALDHLPTDPDAAECHWYGGDIGNTPFLVPIRPELFRIYLKEGEETFRSALRPGIVKIIESCLSCSAVQHGLAFVMKLPIPISHVVEILKGLGFTAVSCREEEKDLGNAWFSCIIKGEMLGFNLTSPANAAILNGGILHSNDWEDLALEGPHLVALANGLA